MWWKDANASQRATVRRLVQEGRLEWTGGGWTQHDEAASRVEDQIDNLALGHLWLRSVVGSGAVTSAWQPDPFGHSATAAYIFRIAGFDFYAFGRGATEGDPINQQTAALWHPLKSFPNTGVDDVYTILTREQRTGYWNPFRSNHGALLSQDAESVGNNLILLSQDLVATAHPAASNVLIMFGDDHRWEDAQFLMGVLEHAIEVVNGQAGSTGITMQFSTPSRFAKALNQERISFPPRPAEWDMLPLIGDEMSAPWSGFFTSRPGFKALVRASSATWRAAQQLHALSCDPTKWMNQFGQLLPLWKAIGLAVAHDALPGDGFAIVSDDFTHRLRDGIARAALVASEGAATLLANAAIAEGTTIAHDPSAPPQLHPCTNATGELCAAVSQALGTRPGGSAIITVYNPQMRARTSEAIALLVPRTAAAAGLTVSGLAGNSSNETILLPCQLSEPYHGGTATALLTFTADLLPLGLHSFTISTTNVSAPDRSNDESSSRCEQVKVTTLPHSGAMLQNAATRLAFDSAGNLQQMIRRDTDTMVNISASILSYQSLENSENSWDFTTNGGGSNSAIPFPGVAQQHATVARGAIFDEVTVTIDASQGISLRYRLYHGTSTYAHVLVSSGPFDVVEHKDQNVILRFNTSIESGTRLLVDSNAMEMVPRDRDKRPWQAGPWKDALDPVSSNYYPTTLAAILPSVVGAESQGKLAEDRDNPALAVVVGSAQGVGSMASGQLELMVNRAVLKGSKDEPTSCANSTDNHLVTLHHILMLSKSTNADAPELTGEVRPVAAALANPVAIFARSHTVLSEPGSACTPGIVTPVPLVSHELPRQLELLSLQMLPPGMNISLIDDPATQYNSSTKHNFPPPLASSAVMVLRLRHLFAVGDGGQTDPDLGKAVSIDLATLFAPRWTVTRAVETTVNGITPLSEREKTRLHWQQQTVKMQSSDTLPRQETAAVATPPGLTVKISPMEVRTWRLTVQ